MLNQYLLELKTKGFSYELQIGSRFVLQLLMDYVAKTFSLADWCEIEEKHLQSFVIYLTSEYQPQRGKLKLSPASLKSRVFVVKRFFRWLFQSQRLLHNPAARLVLPKITKSLPQVRNESEVERILEQIPVRTSLDIRDRAILETLYATGIRMREVYSLNLIDVDLGANTLHIREGKGGQDRFVPLTENACEWLTLYITTARIEILAGKCWREGKRLKLKPVTAPISALWLSQPGKRLSYWMFYEIVKKYADQSAIKASGHSFRHSIATHLLRNGANILEVQQLLGHKRLNTTQIYTHLDLADLQRAVENAFENLAKESEFEQ